VPTERDHDREIVRALQDAQYVLRLRDIRMAVKKILFDLPFADISVRPDFLIALLDDNTGQECRFALQILQSADEDFCSAGFLQLARDTARCWHPDRFSAFTGEAVEENASAILRMRKAYIAAIGEFCVTSALGDWAEWVPEGKVGVIARQVERVDHLGRPTYGEAEVCALIAKDLYAARGEVTALRDTAHEVIPMPEALRPKRVG